MFKPCPNCGFLVALISGREASQRCPRCGSGLLEEGDVLSPAEREALPARRPEERRRSRVQQMPEPPPRGDPARAQSTLDDAGNAATARGRDRAPGTQERSPGRDGDLRGVAHVRAPVGDDDPADPAPARPGGVDERATAHVDHAGDADGVGDTDTPPSFAARRRDVARRHGRRWPWAVALPLLAGLLALQLLLSQRVELAANARWRPAVAFACGVLGCDVPAWREPRAFAMLARSVRPHGARPGVLQVTTSIRNDARWPQPLPVVVLSLSDLDGRVLAARPVAPAEYGRPTPVLVAPGDSVDIAFDVREPSPRVVSFDFQLR